jgi:FtsH-binding integral membrane protein
MGFVNKEIVVLQKLDTATSLAFLVTGAFILVVFGWMFFPPKASDAGSLAVLNTLTGVLGTSFVSIMTFYFGSSKGSKDKDDTISQMAVAGAQNGNSAAPASNPAPAPVPATPPAHA